LVECQILLTILISLHLETLKSVWVSDNLAIEPVLDCKLHANDQRVAVEKVMQMSPQSDDVIQNRQVISRKLPRIGILRDAHTLNQRFHILLLQNRKGSTVNLSTVCKFFENLRISLKIFQTVCVDAMNWIVD